MKAEVWNVKTCDSILDHVHNFYRMIIEFYIPKEKISFNYTDNNLVVFISDGKRYNRGGCIKVKDIEIDTDVISMLIQYIELKSKLIEEVKKIQTQ